MPPLNATDLQMYPCAGNPPIDAFMNDLLALGAGTFIDAIAGANTNRGLSPATAIADPFELEQRWGGGRVTEQGPVGNSPPVPRRAAGTLAVVLVNVVSGWILRAPFEMARPPNQASANLGLAYSLPLNGVGVALNATLTFWDEGGTCGPFSQIQILRQWRQRRRRSRLRSTNPGQQITIQWDGANWQVIANSNPGGAPGTLGQRVTFVFRPGGVASENVYTSWAAMMADVASVAGPKWIEIDSSLAAAHVPAGNWNIGDCTFSSAQNGLIDTLIWDDGAHALFGASAKLQMYGVNFQSASTTPVATMSSGLLLLTEANINSQAAPAVPWLSVTGNGVFAILYGGGFGDGTHNAVTVGVGFTMAVNAQLTGSVFAHAFGGLGRVNIGVDDTSAPAPPAGNAQDIAVAFFFFLATAGFVGFSPGVAGNWNPVPTAVKAALDQLAAPNEFAETNAGPTPIANPTSYTSVATISKKRSGKVRVSVNVGLASSAQDQVHMQIFRDTTATLMPPINTTGMQPIPVLGGSMSLEWIDTLPDLLPHSYGFVATSVGGATLSAATANVSVVVEEL